MSMRELVLDKIELIRIINSGFAKWSTRWRSWYLNGNGTLVAQSSKEGRQLNKTAKHLSMTTRDDFDALSDDDLLDSLQAIIQRMARQM